MPLTIQVGQSATATVTVLDQNGSPIADFDFTTNAPSWSIDNPAIVAISTGPTPAHEICTGAGAGSAVLSVSVPGVTNPSASDTITVSAPPPVPTSVQISFS